MYSAIFSLRLLCAIYIGSVVWFDVRQAKIPLFTQKRNRRPGDKTIRTTFPTKGKQTGQIRRRTCLDTKPTKQSKRSSRPDKNVPDKSGEDSIPTDENPAPVPVGRDGPNDRLQQIKRTKRTRQAKRTPRPTKAQAPVKRHDTAPAPTPFLRPPEEPAGASFPRISRSLGTADGFPELSQPARHTNIPRLTSTTSIPAAMPQRTPHRKRRQNADGR